MSKPKKKVRFEDDEPVTKRSVETKPDTSLEPTIGSLIEGMKNLNLKDPEVRALWTKAMRTNPETQHAFQKLNALTARNIERDIPPHVRNEGSRYIQNGSTFEREIKRCYRCGKMGHTMSRCEQVLRTAEQGVI